VEPTPICDYEGSTYQNTFWDAGGRTYEDTCEALALKRLLPKKGRVLLELGAGAGRNTPRYSGFERIVLLDYSRTQLEQARIRLGDSDRFMYVAANIYNLPFVPGLFDAATMIRTLHHMADPVGALREVRRVLQPDSTFIMEFANKQNLKAILRYFIRRQSWSPFSLSSEEYIPLHFVFHPKIIRRWLSSTGFSIRSQVTVSHFRVAFMKKLFPSLLLAYIDSFVGYTGNLWQLSPSVFVLSKTDSSGIACAEGFFQCPQCKLPLMDETGSTEKAALRCRQCGQIFPSQDGIYDFRGTFSL
jgi:ubiquinone/menaquinone biosynthesis C-methylase UbiE